MKVFLEYDGEKRYWKYYYYYSENYKITVEEFKNHILALDHAKNILGEYIIIVNK